MEITGSTTLGELRQAPEFEEFGQFLSVDCTTTQDEIDKMTMNGWGPELEGPIINGFNRIQEVEHQGVRVSYDIWSEEERTASPDKQMTNLIYFPGEPGRPFIIVCPGGAYTAVASYLEGYPPAAELNALGYNAFVLTYRVGQNKILPKPQEDLAQAIRFVREHADEFQVPAGEYAVMGFSAGGHLAATWGSTNMGYQVFDLPKPGALLLGYPGVSTTVFDPEEEVAHIFLTAMVGQEITPETLDPSDVTAHMDETFPPTYIIHSKDDPLVPVSSSARCAERCRELNVPCALNLVEHSGHSFVTGKADSKGWIGDAMAFYEEYRRP